jgi:hypothetical protein
MPTFRVPGLSDSRGPAPVVQTRLCIGGNTDGTMTSLAHDDTNTEPQPALNGFTTRVALNGSPAVISFVRLP